MCGVCVFARSISEPCAGERGDKEKKREEPEEEGAQSEKEGSPRYDGLAKPSTVPARLL